MSQELDGRVAVVMGLAGSPRGVARATQCVDWLGRGDRCHGVEGHVMARVWKKGTKGIPHDAVYIGRPSKFGNPFVIGRDGTRGEVIAKYRRWLATKPQLLEAAKTELRGKDLVCFCHPLPCHGDVLVEVANESAAAAV